MRVPSSPSPIENKVFKPIFQQPEKLWEYFLQSCEYFCVIRIVLQTTNKAKSWECFRELRCAYTTTPECGVNPGVRQCNGVPESFPMIETTGCASHLSLPLSIDKLIPRVAIFPR